MEDLQALDQHYFSLATSIMIHLIIFRHPHPAPSPITPLSPVYKCLKKNLICLNIKNQPPPSPIELSTHLKVP